MQRRILEIVEREPIDTQEQLQQKLQEQGVSASSITAIFSICSSCNIVRSPFPHALRVRYFSIS